MNPVTKSYIALAIMFGCFVVLYPKVFHPWIKIIFGLNPKPQAEEQPFHPRDRAMRGMQGMQGQARDAPPTQRMHPGARFQEDATKRQTSTKGGMSSFMLPVYAIGIMLYLGYTLLKIWSKRNNQNESAEDWLTAQRQRSGQMQQRNRAAGNQVLPGQGQPAARTVKNNVNAVNTAAAADSDAAEANSPSGNDSNNLASLLRNADFDSMSYAELRALRRRLEETETKMTSLLKEVGAASKAAESLVSAAGDSIPRSSEAADADADDAEDVEEGDVESDQDSESLRNRSRKADNNASRKSEADSETEKTEEAANAAAKNAAKKKKKKQKQKAASAAKKQQQQVEAETSGEKQQPAPNTVRKRTATAKNKRAVAESIED